MPPCYAACKVLLSGMQTLENYPGPQCGLLHDTNADCCLLHTARHMTQIHFYETNKMEQRVFCIIINYRGHHTKGVAIYYITSVNLQQQPWFN
jgi:hypothetical protein